MAVRKTESRLPFDLSPEDLGQAVQSADGKVVLVSFLSSPIVVNRLQQYVVFVTDTTLAGQVSSYEWEFQNGDDTVNQQSSFGEISYTPPSAADLRVTVRVLDDSAAIKGTVVLNQAVVQTNEALEGMIQDAANAPGPGIGNIDVARELVNDHNIYYQNVALQNPENGNGFKRFVFSMACEGIASQSPDERKNHAEALAESINGDTEDFVRQSMGGKGVCAIRMVVLAMIVENGLAWTELPENGSQRAAAEQELRENIAQLEENVKIDLFNLLRFPKSNIVQCGRILEALRDRYFNGTNFTDVLEGMSGTRAFWINKHYKEGPVVH
ncbi:hypothetical protein [Spongiimicrobium salis]|uniref:hypothetical protein n=1 Tax=Spongiimicrobium salis TaxID=1667022 RepID=UPI00374D9CE4